MRTAVAIRLLLLSVIFLAFSHSAPGTNRHRNFRDFLTTCASLLMSSQSSRPTVTFGRRVTGLFTTVVISGCPVRGFRHPR